MTAHTPESAQTSALAAFYAAVAEGHKEGATPAQRLAVHDARLRYDAAVRATVTVNADLLALVQLVDESLNKSDAQYDRNGTRIDNSMLRERVRALLATLEP